MNHEQLKRLESTLDKITDDVTRVVASNKRLRRWLAVHCTVFMPTAFYVGHLFGRH